jgi:hypothetical protein
MLYCISTQIGSAGLILRSLLQGVIKLGNFGVK